MIDCRTIPEAPVLHHIILLALMAFIAGCGVSLTVPSEESLSTRSKPNVVSTEPREPTFGKFDQALTIKNIEDLQGKSFRLKGGRLSMMQNGFSERRFQFQYSANTRKLEGLRCDESDEASKEWSVFGGTLRRLSLNLSIPFEFLVADDVMKPSEAWQISLHLQGRRAMRTCESHLSTSSVTSGFMILTDVFKSKDADTSGIWTLKTPDGSVRGSILRTPTGLDLFIESTSSGGSSIVQLEYERGITPIQLRPPNPQRQDSESPSKSRDNARDITSSDAESTNPPPQLPDRRIVVTPTVPGVNEKSLPPPYIEVPPAEQEAFLKDASVECANLADCPESAVMLVGQYDETKLYLCSGIRVGPDLIATNSHCLPHPKKSDQWTRPNEVCKDSLWVLSPKTQTRPAEREECLEVLHYNVLSEEKFDNQDWAVIRVKDPVRRGSVKLGQEPFVQNRTLQMWAMDPIISSSGLHGRIVRKTCEASDVSFYRRDKEYPKGTYPNLLLSKCSPQIVSGNSGSGLVDVGGDGRATLRALVSAGQFPNGSTSAENGLGPNAYCMAMIGSERGRNRFANSSACRIVPKAMRDLEENPETVSRRVKSELDRAVSNAKGSGIFGNDEDARISSSFTRFFEDFRQSPLFRILSYSGTHSETTSLKLPQSFDLGDGTLVSVPDYPLKSRVAVYYNPYCIDYPEDFGKNILFGIGVWPEQFREDISFLPRFLSPVRYRTPATVSAPVKWFTIDIKLRSSGVPVVGDLQFDHTIEEHQGIGYLTLENYVKRGTYREWEMAHDVQARWQVVDPKSGETLFERQIDHYCSRNR